MVPFAGWEMPVQYAGVTKSTRPCARPRGSSTSRTWARCSSAANTRAQVVDYLITNDASRLVDGQALYTCACNETAGSSTISSSTASTRRTGSSSATRQPRQDGGALPRAASTTATSKTRPIDRADRPPGPEGGRDRSAMAETARCSRLARSTSATRTRQHQVHRRAHRLHGRRRLRDLLRARAARPRCSARLSTRHALRPRARGPRRPRHAAPRGAPLALRQRHRRDDEPLEAGPRLGGQARQGLTSSAKTRSRIKAEGPEPQDRGLRDGRAEASRATATRCSTARAARRRRVHQRQPLAHHRQEHRPRLRARPMATVGTKLRGLPRRPSKRSSSNALLQAHELKRPRARTQRVTDDWTDSITPRTAR
jgi:hypothetical protein